MMKTISRPSDWENIIQVKGPDKVGQALWGQHGLRDTAAWKGEHEYTNMTTKWGNNPTASDTTWWMGDVAWVVVLFSLTNCLCSGTVGLIPHAIVAKKGKSISHNQKSDLKGTLSSLLAKSTTKSCNIFYYEWVTMPNIKKKMKLTIYWGGTSGVGQVGFFVVLWPKKPLKTIKND